MINYAGTAGVHPECNQPQVWSLQDDQCVTMPCQEVHRVCRVQRSIDAASCIHRERNLSLVRAGTPRFSRPTEWEYVDPKGAIQGPFSSKEMLKWADAGFFTPDQQVQCTFFDACAEAHVLEPRDDPCISSAAKCLT